MLNGQNITAGNSGFAQRGLFVEKNVHVPL
jgi:hypothetical protein